MIPRFSNKYQVDEQSGCWNWVAADIGNGYGVFWHDGKNILAHRFSYMVNVGELDSSLEIDHLCRNKKCVNPEHLEQVTRSENQKRRPYSKICEHNLAITTCVYCEPRHNAFLSKQWREKNKEHVAKLRRKRYLEGRG
jgi:hypothetical protein